MASGPDTPMEGLLPDQQPKASDTSRRKPITDSPNKTAKEIIGPRNPNPPSDSFFPDPAQVQQTHGMHSRPGNWPTQGSIPPQSMHDQPAASSGSRLLAPRPEPGYNMNPAQQPYMPYNQQPSSMMAHQLAYNMGPQNNGYGAPLQRPPSGYHQDSTQTHNSDHQLPGAYASTLGAWPLPVYGPPLPSSSIQPVIGSQGRRGRLPVSVGHAQPQAAPIFTKDAEGKWLCPSCSKTYKYQKHAKRHFLRHTGSRPYVCPLCSSDFSRSDILKRHYAICATRQGLPVDPTGHMRLKDSIIDRNEIPRQNGSQESSKGYSEH